MESQLFVAQLPILLQKRATQYRFHRLTFTPAVCHRTFTQISFHPFQYLRVAIQPI